MSTTTTEAITINTNQNKKSSKSVLPDRLRQSLDNGSENLQQVQDRLKNLRITEYNDTVALENIIRVLDANDKIKAERNQKRRVSRGTIKIDSSYSVIFASDTLSKNLINLTRRVNQLNNAELTAIQENFLRNNIEDVMNSLNSNKNLVDDTKEIVSVLMKVFSSKEKNANYVKGSIAEEVKKAFEKEKNQIAPEQQTA